MVAAAQQDKELGDEYGQDVVTSLEELVLEQVHSESSVIRKSTPENKEEAEVEEEIGIYEIDFIPSAELFRTGNEPVMILKELSSLGKMEVEIDRSHVPSLEKIDPKMCYVSWHISLETEASLAMVEEVFEFVADDCEYHIEKIGAIIKESKKANRAEKNLQQNNANADAEKDIVAQTVSTIRVDIDKVDRLVNLVGELLITQSMLMVQTRDMPVETFPKLIEGVEELAQHTRELQEAVMSVRMQPVKSVFSRMPRIVRDLSRKLGKDIALKMSGENTEVDKTVIEQLTDPLTHMIRNSVDHGIDTPEARVEKGKPAEGEITLSAEHRGGRIVISVSDDGNGINRENVLAKAKEKNIVASDAERSNEEIDMLIFAPGFSTANEISDVSGRGVGMDVVRRNIESLGGIVTVENKEGEGTKFTIRHHHA